MFLEIPTYLRKQKFDRQIKALHIYEMKCEVFLEHVNKMDYPLTLNTSISSNVECSLG